MEVRQKGDAQKPPCFEFLAVAGCESLLESLIGLDLNEVRDVWYSDNRRGSQAGVLTHVFPRYATSAGSEKHREEATERMKWVTERILGLTDGYLWEQKNAPPHWHVESKKASACCCS